MPTMKEELAELEKLLNREKAAGDRNLESNVKLGAVLSFLEKEIDANPLLKEKYNGFIAVGKQLDEFTKSLYVRDEDGNLPVFDGEKQNRFLRLSGETMNLLSAGTDDAALSEEARKGFAHLGTILEQDVSKIVGMVPDGQSSIAREIEKTEPIAVNVTDKEFSTVGDNSNVRTAMTVTKNGQEVRGFFTAEKMNSYDVKKAVDALEEVMEDQEVPEHLRDAITHGLEKMIEEKDFLSVIPDKALEYVAENGLNGHPATEEEQEDLKIFAGNLATKEPLQGILNEYTNRFSQYTSYIAAIADSNVTNRNVAMSKVANVLGVPELLAQSEPMQIVNGDNTINGVFMANAKGKGYDSILPEDVANVDAHPFNNPSVLKDIADIQILDYICQNIDRHSRNVFYRFSEDGKQIVGIQGIDNDLSFGTVVVKDNEQIGAADVTLKHLGCMSASMKAKLDSLNAPTFKASLVGLGLKQEEIDAAAVRMDRIKQAVADGKIQVFTDGEFAQKTIAELAKLSSDKSVFGRCNALDKEIKTLAGNNQNAKKQEEEDRARTGETKNFHFEKVETLDGISEEQFRKDGDKADELSEQIRKSQKSIWGKGSTEFRGLEDSIKAFAQAAKSMPKDPTQKDYLKFQATMENVLDQANRYLEFKGQSSTNRKTQGRIDLANTVKSYFTERIGSFKHALHRKDEIAVEESNAQLKAMANKLNNLAGGAAAKAEKELQDMKDQGLSQQVASLRADAKIAQMKMKNQAQGIDALSSKEETAKCIAKVVLSDVVLRERLAGSGTGKFEAAVENGKTAELVEAFSKLDTVREAAETATPESLTKLTEIPGIAVLTGKVLGEVQKDSRILEHVWTKDLENTAAKKDEEPTKKDGEEEFVFGGK